MQRCESILATAIGCAMLGALAGVVLANGTLQLLTYCVIGVWGGAIGGGLLGAVRCAFVRKRGVDRGSAGRDLRTEPPKKLAPAGL